jgi:hypothetical protein
MTKSVEELQELAERDVGPGDDSSPSDDATESDSTGGSDSTADASGRSGLRDRLPGVDLPSGGSLFSPRRFLLALALTVGGLVVGGAIPLVGAVTRYAGLFAATFLLGLISSRRSYLECGVAGAVAAAGSFLLGTLSTGAFVLGFDLLQRYGLTVAGVGVGVGFLVAVVGHYFGRDLRAGLTRNV